MRSAHHKIRLTLPWCTLSWVFVVLLGLVGAFIWGPLACKGDIDAIMILALIALLLMILVLGCHRLDKLSGVYADERFIYVVREGTASVIEWSSVKLCHNMGGIPNIMIITYMEKNASAKDKLASVKAVYFGRAKQLIMKCVESYGVTLRT